MNSTFQQDIEAGRGPADEEQYGLPQSVDEERPSPPISQSNFDPNAVPVNESAGLNTAARPAMPVEDESAGLNTAGPANHGIVGGALDSAADQGRQFPPDGQRIVSYRM